MRTPWIRAGVGIALLAASAGCEQRTWTGSLASAADSVFPSDPTAGCDTANASFGFDDVALPLRLCQVVDADTTFAVLSDAERKVLVVTRAWAVDSLRQMTIHDSLQFAIATLYAAPFICAEIDGVGETEVQIWRTLDREITLKNVENNLVVVEVRANHPGCREGG